MQVSVSAWFVTPSASVVENAYGLIRPGRTPNVPIPLASTLSTPVFTVTSISTVCVPEARDAYASHIGSTVIFVIQKSTAVLPSLLLIPARSPTFFVM
ncbi:hypothetical protein BJY18_003100 [Amycolatopsis jiangsuensis]|uniref:Uncharacterized protein n=1 Tax=Amycolatopsis jiangsuensis TaxID=1181879 RepID=A0A840IW03_9PSEU|nr:hypothetical protein [Amycolatopsis jiangsuensis]